MRKNRFRFERVGGIRVIPISMKILAVFIVLLLLSCFSTNLISTLLSQNQIINLTNTILTDQLKAMVTNAANQYQISRYSGDEAAAILSLRRSAKDGLSYPRSVACAVRPDGSLAFLECGGGGGDVAWTSFGDRDTLDAINRRLSAGISEGSLSFNSLSGEYFGVYKYQEDWNFYLIRAELRSDTRRTMYLNFGIISIIIVVLSLAFLWAGLFLFNRILRHIGGFTKDLFAMQSGQRLGIIDISAAPSDDVTYFAASFNALSASVNNLLTTFQKFVSKDIVTKVYSDHGISLEGSQRDLTILFSDIRSFTYRTETLGNEIIDLLNVHYDRVIRIIHEDNGVIGSIIGDAILGIFGTETAASKSADALTAAWEITRVTEELREAIRKRRTEIETRRALTEAEERVYKACLIDIGVGIDGGNVFYGNIGSREHMANTVIGDNVNSASRFEGLTRVYQLPVIVSEFIRDEAEKTTDRYRFYEIDTVQVKGKTEGKKIFFPSDTHSDTEDVAAAFAVYGEALELYYGGKWSESRKKFRQYKKSMEGARPAYAGVADVFLNRMGLKEAPADWRGIWTMTAK